MEDILNRTYKENVEKKYKILYVDDEEVNLRVFNRNFSKYYDIYTAIDAFEAKDILAKTKIDLIMTDQMMPRMNGSELLLEIVPKYPSIIRMIMTGFSDEEDISEVIEKIGLDSFLKKPWDPYKLKVIFDDALQERENKIKEKTEEIISDRPSYSVAEDSLDLLESTMSLVEETQETKQLKKDLTSLVSETKNKKADFMDSGLNYLVNLRDAMLPIQQELKLYAEDAFIVYDKSTLNQNGYWFGECGNKIIVISYHTNSHARESLTLNSFVSTTLTEIVYKEKCIEPQLILKLLAKRIKVRFLDSGSSASCPVEIGVLAVDQDLEEVKFSGAYHNLYSLDNRGGFVEHIGNAEALVPGDNLKINSMKLSLAGIKAFYLVPFSVLEETNENRNNSDTLKSLLDEIQRMPFGMQSKMFREYSYKSVIGLKF